MAGRIAGITIEIGGDTTNLQKSLKAVDKQLKTTQSNLKDIDKLLKLDPANVDLLSQKQKNLSTAISATKDRLDELKTAQEGVEKGSDDWDALQREIIETENNLKDLQQQYKDFGSVASQEIKAVGQSLKNAGSKVTDFGKKLSKFSGAAAAIGTGLLKLGYDAVTGADDLNTLSKQTGFSTEELQRMQYAADLVDVSVEDITGALRKFKTKVDPANKALQTLGVSTTNADGSMRDVTDVFYDALQALSAIGNETEKDQLAMELFGKGADSLAGIIDDGGAAMQALGDEAAGLGLILDQDTLDSLNTTNDTIDKMKGQISGIMTVIGTVLGIAAALAPVIILGGQLISGLGTIVTAIGAVVGVLGGPLTIAIAAIIAVGVLLYKNWDKIKTVAEDLAKRVKTSWDNIKSEVTKVVDAVKDKIDEFKKKFEELKEKVTGVWDTIKGLMEGEIKFPHIPLPHFSVFPPGWRFSDLLSGTIPSLSVEWYKKAYDNPVMFTSPTVMATPDGLKGFGDGHGAEIVMGLNKLRELVGENQPPVVINVYANSGDDLDTLADKIQNRFVALAKQRKNAYA